MGYYFRERPLLKKIKLDLGAKFGRTYLDQCDIKNSWHGCMVQTNRSQRRGRWERQKKINQRTDMHA